MSRQPRHRKEPRHRLDGPADHGHAAVALVLPVLLGGVLLLVAVSSGHWSYLVRHVPKWPIAATPNGFTVLTLALICGVGYAGWRLLSNPKASIYELHEYDDSGFDPPEAYEIEEAARRPRRAWLENLRIGAAHYYGRRLIDLDGPEPEDPWFGCRADKVQAGSIRDLWLTEPSRAPQYDDPADEPEW